MSRQDRLSCRDKTDKTRQTVFVSCRIACLSVLSRQDSLSCRDKTYKTVACRVCLVTTRQDRHDSLLRQETGKTRQTRQTVLSRQESCRDRLSEDRQDSLLRQDRQDTTDKTDCHDSLSCLSCLDCFVARVYNAGFSTTIHRGLTPLSLCRTVLSRVRRQSCRETKELVPHGI